jgi:hypothetical protein
MIKVYVIAADRDTNWGSRPGVDRDRGSRHFSPPDLWRRSTQKEEMQIGQSQINAATSSMKSASSHTLIYIIF